jgi:GDP-4-dehydro-6-deoxy-D-mannose reductase
VRILVTGALGFAGRHLCATAALRGHEVVGSGVEDLARAEGVEGLAAYRVCDVRHLGEVEALYQELQPEAVIHLAAQSSGAAAFHDPPTTFHINAGGTLNLLEAARRREFTGPILAVTSSEAYGRIPLGRPADESTPLRPVSPYGVSKAAADAAAQMYAVAYGLRVIRARSFAHTGPGQATEFVASAWAQQVAQAEARAEAGERAPFVIRIGNVDPVRDLGDALGLQVSVTPLPDLSLTTTLLPLRELHD